MQVLFPGTADPEVAGADVHSFSIAADGAGCTVVYRKSNSSRSYLTCDTTPGANRVPDDLIRREYAVQDNRLVLRRQDRGRLHPSRTVTVPQQEDWSRGMGVINCGNVVIAQQLATCS